MDTKKLIRQLYPETQRPRNRLLEGSRRRVVQQGSRLRRLVGWFASRFRKSNRRLGLWARRNRWKLVVGAVVTLFWAGLHLRFYNQVIMLEQEIHVTWAQVEAEQERRYHIQQSMVRQIIAYAQHERSLMLDLTDLRTGKNRGALQEQESIEAESAPGSIGKPPAAREQEDSAADVEALPISRYAPPGSEEPALAAVPRVLPSNPGLDLMKLDSAELNSVFPEVMLVAEQYPSLRLAENFQQFADSVVATETRITERIQKYNMAVNMYTTMITTFPGKFLSRAWGFEMYDFYEPKRDEVTWKVQNFSPQTPNNRVRAGAALAQ